MPDSVKISDLPARTALPLDVLPAVDSASTATVRVTAQSIAEIGGGPPGDNTVSTVKIQNSAVNFAKMAQLAPMKLIGNDSTSTTQNPIAVTMTSVGKQLLQAYDQTAARSIIGSSIAFTGQTTFGKGTANRPALACNDTSVTPNFTELDTGILWPDYNTLAISTEGTIKFYIDADGTQFSNLIGVSQNIGGIVTPITRPQYSCRAWASFDGGNIGSLIIDKPAEIGSRYGLIGSLFNDANTRSKISALETARSLTIDSFDTVQRDGRENYTTPGDNKHWYWNPVATGGAKFEQITAVDNKWIGKITITSTTQPTVYASQGVTSIERVRAGIYKINFLTAMPDTKYAVVISSSRGVYTDSGDMVLERTTSSCTVQHFEGWNSQTNDISGVKYGNNCDYIAVAVFR